VTCRRWNWRQGVRTRLTDDTTRAFFVFDRLPALAEGDLDAAAGELVSLLEERWPGCATEQLRLSRVSAATGYPP
jgi:DNA/RNA-binding domain of Phe-tRNA-synthetase-like protein